MKNTKIKGFSLAEVMIAMLVISIALAAAIPTITKRNAGSDNIWRAGTQTVGGATEEDANTLAFTGPNILIGASRLPLLSNDRYFADSRFDDGLKISPKDDKLIIFKEIADNVDRFKSSHIGLYNSPTEYAGRLASDKYNLALGIGTLQSLQPNYPEGATAIPQGAYNTAIGQYALLTNEKGSYNTAFGYNALKGNGANINTSDINISGNIALGDNTLMNVENGSNNNIAIGSHAGETLTGSNNIVIGANTGKDLTGSDNILITTMNGNPTSELEDLLRGSRDDDKYPLIGDSGNFAIGILNNKKANKLLPPIIQGFATIQTCSGNTQPCADGVLYAKGLIINADTFNIKTKDGAKTIFSVRENPSKKNFSDANKDLNSAVNIATATETPCDGAPICLAKFNVTTGSFYTNDGRHDVLLNGYTRKSTYPRFKSGEINNTALEDNNFGVDHYDLFIGSINYGGSSNFSETNATNFAKNLIDVGKQETNDPLILADLSGSYSETDGWYVLENMDDAKRPKSFIDTKSLKIRTVKTAVNFLDEFKEKSNILDRLRDTIDFNISSLFTYPDNVKDVLKYSSSCNTSGERSNWEKIKSCDPDYYKEEGLFLLEGFCDVVWAKKKERGEFFEAYKECDKTHTMLYCLVDTLFKEATDEDDSVDDAIENFRCRIGTNTAAIGYATDKCFGKVIGYSKCYNEAKQEYINNNSCSTGETESDARLKNIAGDNTAGLKEINKLQVYNYTYKADKSQTPHVGVMAQDLKKVFPNAVKKGSDGYYRIRLEDMFYAMVNSIKELTKKKDELNTLTVDYIDAPLSELEKQNSDIKAQNEMLKQKNAEIEKRLSQMEAK